MINSIEELKLHFGVTTVAGIQKVIFKSTECGCVFNEVPDGVEVCGYAEGADAECVAHALSYPFKLPEFYAALSEADQEGIELYDEWNGEDDMQDTIDDDNRQRAADCNAVLSGGGY